MGVVAVAVCVCLSARAEHVHGQTTVMTRPLSASVQGTFISEARQIEILILWRGAPGWFFTPEHSQGGGAGTVVNGTLEYGSIRLDYSYDRVRRALQIGERIVPLAPGENVVLVDDIERSGGRVMKALALDFRFDSPNPTLASILGPSAEVVAFLRCDRPGPDPRMQSKLNAMACDDLKSR